MSERMDQAEMAAMLAAVREYVSRYVQLPGADYLNAIVLWIAHAHVIASADTSPRLVFKSPEKESGKTRALEVLELVVPSPKFTMNSTIAAIFRRLKENQVTLLIDEVDAIFNPKAGNHEDLRALLNAGYRRGATVDRVVGEGKKMHVEDFPVFAATALAAIGDLPDTIESRAIIVPMRRRAPDEQVESFRRRKAEEAGTSIRDWLARWADAYGDLLAEAEPETPASVVDRAADIWEPLLAIADLVGGEWPALARQAAVVIVGGRVAEDASVGVRLLADIQSVMSQDRVPSADLLGKLNGLEESGYGGWNDGKGINARDLARRLKPYGIEPKVVRQPDGSTPRGYLREQFHDAWSRYLRHVAQQAQQAQQDVNSNSGDVAGVAPVADRDGNMGTLSLRLADAEPSQASAKTLSASACPNGAASEDPPTPVKVRVVKEGGGYRAATPSGVWALGGSVYDDLGAIKQAVVEHGYELDRRSEAPQRPKRCPNGHLCYQPATGSVFCCGQPEHSISPEGAKEKQ